MNKMMNLKSRSFGHLLLTLFCTMNLAFANAAGETITFFHHDHLGTPIVATNESGNKLWEREYTAFGNAKQNGDAETIGYAGHEFTAESGMTNMGARWYSGELGRFLSPDPVTFVPSNTLSFNRYLYGNNNPYTFYDPDGEYFDLAIEVVSIGIGIFSAGKNIAQGNYREAAYDAAGVGVDVLLAIIPGVPGGTGLARQAAKNADEVLGLGTDASKITRTCSFLAGTPVATETGTKAIESFSEGDLLLSKNEFTRDLTLKPVLDAYSTYHIDGMKLVVADAFGNQETIYTTTEHPFYTKKFGFVAAGLLEIGENLSTASNDYSTVVEVDLTPYDLVAYNFEVADYHTYFVGEQQLWVHNDCGVTTSGQPGSYTPDRTLPTDKHGVPIPDSNLPHTQLGRSKPKYGSEPQAREWGYGDNGNLQPKRDIDFTDHGYPDAHPDVPHQHKLTPVNPTLAPKGGYQRGPAEPL